MTHTILITGASRGLGLEFTKQYAAANWRVLACCRQPEKAQALQTLTKQHQQLSIHPLDVTELNEIQQLAKNLSTTAIDVLLLNAGIYGKEGIKLGHVDPEDMQHVFRTNVIAPLQLIEKLHAPVAKSQLKKIIYISSAMGSIDENSSGGSYAYRISKAAGNMMMKNITIELASADIHVLILHPGWVKTDMGGANAPLDATTSIAGMRKVISRTDIPSGSFYCYDGTKVPW